MVNACSKVSRFRSVCYFTLTFFCLLLIPAQRLIAQVDEGAISGTVQDSTGAIITNAKVTLLNTDQGLTLETSVTSGGTYSFSPVRIGNYKITVTASGFGTTTQEHITVAVGQSVQVNVELKPGSGTETVTVSTAPPQLQTDDAAVGQVVSEHTINSLPLNGRNFTFLAQLGAGINVPQNDTRGNGSNGAFTANGLRPSQNNYLLDGIDNNNNAVDFLNGTNFAVLPPVDAIQEFNVQTADFSAQLGRSAGAVLNATVKSGTNSIHGAAWEFFRNDVLDAKNYFDVNKGELRLNQFGGAIGGPIIKNKLFFFGDYEGLRRVEGSSSGLQTVPTLQERSSGYTDLSQLITGNTKADLLGRTAPVGTVYDPATTRQVTAGVADPVSGIVATSSGYVRDPFGTCGAGTTTYTAAACGLNQLPAGRLDANAIKLLNLYPNPTNGNPTGNFSSNPNTFQHSNQFDVRGDFDPNDKNQIFVRFSYVDNPQFIPGPFGGIADGGSFQQGIQTLKSNQSVVAWTHVFNPTVINVARVGFNHLHTTRFGPEGGTSGIPDQFGIPGVPQVSENGGLPTITFQGLATLGSNNYLPSDETSQTLQFVDDFTKIYGAHSFKTGIEYQDVKFSTLQPAYSRGQYDFNGAFTDIPNLNSNTTGIAQMLISPIASTVANGVPFSGGSDQIQASNINKTYDYKHYFAAYFQDDWKISPRMTLNLGLRYDYFGPLGESNGGQANFIPQAEGPFSGPTFLIPASGKGDRRVSSSTTTPGCTTCFADLLAKDNIALVYSNAYGNGLTRTQKYNFAPRLGFAYQVSPKLIARGGLGWFYNAFENQGYGPNIGENYPFVFNFNFTPSAPGDAPPNSANGAFPIGFDTPYAGCGTGTLNTGFNCLNLVPLAVTNAQGLSLQGLQFNYKTPSTISANFTLQYALTSTLSAQVSYVFTDGMHLQNGVGNNTVTAILPASVSNKIPAAQGGIPFPDFNAGGSYQDTVGDSIYHGLQTKLEQQLSNGVSFLATYTWSKTMSDAGDLLNGGSLSGLRAPHVPGFGPRFDWGPADFDIRNVFHLSGGYELPFGTGKRFAQNASKAENYAIGGWSVNAIVTLQGGQPMTLNCPTGTTTGTNCFDVQVQGQAQNNHIHIDGQNKVNWFGNAKAYQQPCQLGGDGNPIDGTPAGCIPYTGRQILGGSVETTTTPGLKTFDFSAFKSFQLNERFSLQFRSEFFNILNHTNFNAPGFGGNGVVSIANSTNFTNPNFGEIGSTRTNPRQIQFALKLYF